MKYLNIKRTRGALLAYFSVVIIVMFSMVQIASAKTFVSWTPSKIHKALNVGKSSTVSMTLDVHKTIGEAVVSIVPELEAYVSVEPSSFTNLTAGETRDILVHISVPTDAPLGLLDGTIKLKEISGSNKKNSKPLPVTIDVFNIDGDDTDENGIWDYVDEHIDTIYPTPSAERSALQQIALAFQQFLLDADDPIKSLENAEAKGNGHQCLLHARLKNLPFDHNLSTSLESVLVNTKERSDAYLKATEHLSGHVTKRSNSPCKDISHITGE